MEELVNEWKASQPKYLEDPVTTAIPPPLAKTLETWFWSVYSKEEVKNELAKTLRPENATALIPTRINEAVFHSLEARALSKDMPCRFIQNAFMKATQPLVTVWDTLIQLENHLKTSGKNLQVRFTNNLTIDFQQLRKLLDQSLQLLGIANSQMVKHRKDILSQFLNKDFRKICRSHVPFDQWMFGSNLRTLLEDIAHVNPLVQQNKPTQNPSTRGSFSRGRGNQPAQRGFQRGRFPKQQGRGSGRGWQLNANT